MIHPPTKLTEAARTLGLNDAPNGPVIISLIQEVERLTWHRGLEREQLRRLADRVLTFVGQTEVNAALDADAELRAMANDAINVLVDGVEQDPRP